MIDQLRTNRTLRELILGAFAYCVLWEIPLLVFAERRLYHTIGLAAGFLICVVLAALMAESIDVAVELDEKGARAYLQKKASLRYLIACISIVVMALTDIGNPLTFFAGIMGLKIGAYIQPLTHRAICMVRGTTDTAAPSADEDNNNTEHFADTAADVNKEQENRGELTHG